MCCNVGIELLEHGARPGYEGDDARRCARGHYLAELLGLPVRLNDAIVRDDGKTRITDIGEALGICAAKAKDVQAGEAAILIDGNMRCEDIRAAAALAEACFDVKNAAVFLPPADEALLDGMSSVGFEPVNLEGLSQASIVLMIGDGFATHPMIGRPVLDARNAARENKLIVVDCLRGKSSKFARDVVTVAPGGEAAFMAAVAKSLPEAADVLKDRLGDEDVAALAEKAGVSEDDVKGVAEALKGAKSFCILVSAVSGRGTDYEMLGAMAAGVAAALKGGVLPLLAYGNSLGAYRMARTLGLGRAGAVLSAAQAGKVKVLAAVGVDLSSVLPAAVAGEIRKKTGFIMSVLPAPPCCAELSDVVLPCGLWFEAAGTFLDVQRGVEKCEPVMPPPQGALEVAAVMERLAEGLGASGLKGFEESALQASKVEPSGAEGAELPQAKDGEFVIVGDAGGVHFFDGFLTGKLTWPQRMEGEAVVRLNPDDAAALEVEEGDKVALSSGSAETEMTVEICRDVPKGVAAVPIHFAAAREILRWRLDDGSGRVRVNAAPAKLRKLVCDE